jgi:tRNA A-37 threonylcarbamoyl transferase component Bud32
MTDVAENATPLGPILGDGAQEISFGKYRLIRKIAVGGMAEVYLAKSFGQFGFEKPVVIKVMLPKLSADKEFVEMFVREALMAADFRHPRLCQVYDVGEAAGLYYICMEFVDGVDLTRMVRQANKSSAPTPMRIALKIARDLTTGLQYVHTAKSADGSPLRIVHRDVTPQNIMVGFDGQVKLVDFGVAQTSLAEELKRAALKGKGPYMAPEQWRGDDVDNRADIFALGIVLYELTVGKRLFKRESPTRVRKAILSGEITPPLLVRSDYSPALEEVVLKALAPNPDQRYQTAAKLCEDLTELMVEEGLDASTDEMATHMCKLFAGVSRDEVFRPLELTAPGHAATAAAAVERDEASASMEVEPDATTMALTPLRRLLALGALLLLVGAYVLGAVIHGASSRRSGRSERSGRSGRSGPPTSKGAAAMAAASHQPQVPVIATPAPAPGQLVGCTVWYAAVSVDVSGRVTAVDPDRFHVRCPGRPQAHLSLTLRNLAVQALNSWRFTPVQFRGRPVATTTPLTVTFHH